MIKRIIYLFFISCSFILTNQCFAQQSFVEGNLKYTIWGNALSVSCANKNVKNVVVPASVTRQGKTYVVGELGHNAFSKCEMLESVTILSEGFSVLDGAFKKCFNLREIIMPNCKSVPGIGNPTWPTQINDIFESNHFSTVALRVNNPQVFKSTPWNRFFNITSSSGSNIVQEKVWVQLTKDFPKYTPIYDIRVDTKTSQQTDQYIGVIFKGLFLNTHNWNYNFSEYVEGSKRFKLSKQNTDNDGYRHLDFSSYRSIPTYVINIEKNALINNVQVLVDNKAKALNSSNNNVASKTENKPIIYGEALKYYDKALAGDAEAQYGLAQCYNDGVGVVKNDKDAFMWYCKAAEQGHLGGMYYRAAFYENGRGVEKDEQKANRLYKELLNKAQPLAQQGNASAAWVMARFYYYGTIFEENEVEAAKWYRKAAELGHSYAQNFLGNCYYNGNGVSEDKSEAVKWYRKAAELGHSYAQNSLGNCYYSGNGVPKDESEAVKWYRKAANQGNALAQNNLGSCFYHGYGVGQNYKEAVKWYRMASEGGLAEAQNNLANCLYNGKGVSQDYTEAVKWYRKASEGGNNWGSINLGNCYFYGNGAPQDESKAIEYYTKAAKNGNSSGFFDRAYSCDQNDDDEKAMRFYKLAAEYGSISAMNNIGVLYEYGSGVEKNIAEARKWYKKAADLGDEKGKENLQKLINRCSRCDGTGEVECPSCNGYGETWHRPNLRETYGILKGCSRCGGGGAKEMNGMTEEVYSDHGFYSGSGTITCPSCKGKGYLQKSKSSNKRRRR